MKRIMKWVLAATLVCGASVFTSCVDNSTDNPVVPEPGVPAVPDHFINEALMDKTVKPGDDFYMYALGTWFNSHKEGDRGYMESYDAINTNEVEKSLFASDNPLARHLVRNIEAPAPSLNEDVKAVLDYLDIQKPTGIGMLLTEIGKLQDKGLNPIFSKRVDMHMQSHSCQEIVSRGILTQTADYYLGSKQTDALKSYIKPILTAIDNVADPERTKAEGYEAELEERVSAILAEEQLIYATAHGGGDTSDSDRQGLWNVRDIPEYIEAGSIARSRATRAGGGVEDEVTRETLLEAFHPMAGAIFDESPAFKKYVEQKGGITTVLKTMDNCYDYLRYYAVMSVSNYMKARYVGQSEGAAKSIIVAALKQTSPFLMNKLSADVLRKMGQAGADRCLTMLEKMRTVFRQRLETLDWLSDATRQEALKKLEAMQFFVGVPDNLSEGEFTLDEGNTLVEDALSIMAQNEAIRHNMCGKKYEQQIRTIIDYEIDYSVQNAFYNCEMNCLVILPQFISEGMFPADDEYTQYVVATVFAHEMTHGFDAKGAKYDKQGYLRDWWKDEDKAKFEAKQQEMIALYNRLEAYPGQPADGEKTLAENMADYGGMTLAYSLFKQKKIDEGLQGAALDYACQEFFLHYAKLWLRYPTLDQKKSLYLDVHSIPQNRVNGIVTLFDDWYRLFNVTDGKLYLAPEKRVQIW
ncbi:Predicted metalloendopeptidase [Prevotella sp. tc2-28]|uniref:M13-type metalloendopeptidase n=1 Tax=Prevotella sp. tc2-28 TaxID=1761888 RepID=UPI00089D8C0D|nr:M13-type metalloendopeptidase [Prevotella sp. tc2-28]SEA90767.1 Predicted metalloendopeptidase [Prevotella sp. tc2-28]